MTLCQYLQTRRFVRMSVGGRKEMISCRNSYVSSTFVIAVCCEVSMIRCSMCQRILNDVCFPSKMFGAIELAIKPLYRI